MEIKNNITFQIKKKDTHLHSKEHVLAEDLSRTMLEPKRFASYLGIAKLYHESDLRGLARRVSEKSDLPPEARGRYFFACLKGLTKKESTHQEPVTKKERQKKPPEADASAV